MFNACFVLSPLYVHYVPSLQFGRFKSWDFDDKKILEIH